MKQEVLTIRALCTEDHRVQGTNSEAGMVLFCGEANHPNFRGFILPGGCDTQIRVGDTVTMSARYMLEGTDCTGCRCRLFVENTGTLHLPNSDDMIHTVPRIVTDSKALSWLETVVLSGTVSPDGDNRIIVRIFAEDSK